MQILIPLVTYMSAGQKPKRYLQSITTLLRYKPEILFKNKPHHTNHKLQWRSHATYCRCWRPESNDLSGFLFHSRDTFIALYSISINMNVNQREAEIHRELSPEKTARDLWKTLSTASLMSPAPFIRSFQTQTHHTHICAVGKKQQTDFHVLSLHWDEIL